MAVRRKYDPGRVVLTAHPLTDAYAHAAYCHAMGRVLGALTFDLTVDGRRRDVFKSASSSQQRGVGLNPMTKEKDPSGPEPPFGTVGVLRRSLPEPVI
jgi:hypothetical protein